MKFGDVTVVVGIDGAFWITVSELRCYKFL